MERAPAAGVVPSSNAASDKSGAEIFPGAVRKRKKHGNRRERALREG